MGRGVDEGSQSWGQLFISHLMTTWLLCDYVLRICEIIWLGFGENGAVIYMAYQMGIYSFNVIYNFTLSKMFPISLNKV